MNVHKNDVIDFFDGRRVACGLVLDVEDRRVRILDDHGKESKISVSRTLAVTRDPGFPTNAGRDAQVGRLRQISSRREDLKTTIDLRDLWDVVRDDAREISAQELSELFFGRDSEPDAFASLLRAIFEDRLYFRIRQENIEINSVDQVEQSLIQRRKEREKSEFAARAAEFLMRLRTGETIERDAAPEGLIELLVEAGLAGKEWTGCKTVREIMTQAGLSQEWDPFRILVRLGVWTEDENVRLLQEDVPVEFSPEAEQCAQGSAQLPLPGEVEDLSELAAITIDAPSTRDVDDALSLSVLDDGYLIGIHIADASHFIEHDGPLDLEVRQRGISIYLPDITIPMTPRCLSEEAASLTVDKPRPTLSVLVRFDRDGRLLDHRITPAIIRVRERLSYQEADERILKPESPERVMWTCANAVRELRVASGAIIFKDPELSVRVDETGAIDVTVRDRESPSQVLVSEMMILANSLFARFLRDNRVPGIFRSQPPPLEKVELPPEYDPVQSYLCKRSLARGDVGTEAARHHTLGLECYTTATSPLRRYPDLVLQRQIKSVLKTGKPLLGQPEIEKVLGEVSHRLDRASLMERERQRYFLLKYFEQHRSEEFEAVVLQRFPKFHLVQLTQFGFNAVLNSVHSGALSPRERVLVRIERINPREEKLNLSLVRLL